MDGGLIVKSQDEDVLLVRRLFGAIEIYYDFIITDSNLA